MKLNATKTKKLNLINANKFGEKNFVLGVIQHLSLMEMGGTLICKNRGV